jgi:hypothetical protein
MDIAFWATPLLLLPGVALLIVSTSARYAQIHEEIHELSREDMLATPKMGSNLLQRSTLFRNALVSLYLSVAFLTASSLIGGVTSFYVSNSEALVLVLAVSGILCLLFAAIELIRESWQSLRIIREHITRLEIEMTEHESDAVD